ncbi:MAG TPA: helix-turn-helix transcriptional regulator [Ktedonobacteraceae bacterium]|nr:helix-turn-helix transcriptional regulator [Ktedonobacteraceae bacterium]
MSTNNHHPDVLPEANAPRSHPLDSMQFLARLLHLRQTLMVEPHAVVETMCHEVALAAAGQAQLRLYSKQGRLTRVPSFWQSFPVEIDGREYGTLSFAPDATAPDRPVVPVPVAQVAASICALFLYRIELLLLNKGRSPSGNTSITPTFTPREREVLTLLCRGDDLQAITNALHITEDTAGQHRRRIYTKLGVQNEREAVFAAFSAGLFFPLADLAPRILPEHDLLEPR